MTFVERARTLSHYKAGETDKKELISIMRVLGGPMLGIIGGTDRYFDEKILWPIQAVSSIEPEGARSTYCAYLSC